MYSFILKKCFNRLYKNKSLQYLKCIVSNFVSIIFLEVVCLLLNLFIFLPSLGLARVHLTFSPVT